MRALGLGLITGAADDDPSAIGTYASAGAKLGTSFLWTAPITFPMMVAVVYLSSKLGQVTGKGLFAVIRERYPRWFLLAILSGVIVGNTIEAGADIGGGMADSAAFVLPIPMRYIITIVTLVILVLQIWGSYTLIRNIFRWLALSLVAYVGSAFLAKPELRSVLIGTLVPKIRFDGTFLSLLVAVIGTTLSAYLYTWQSNEEVEEKIASGRRRLNERQGANTAELDESKWDVTFGMFFSNLVMYFIILSTAATLHRSGNTEVTSAAQAAAALRPLAGKGAGLLFALGVFGVGFLAVPVMTTGAVYDLCQSVGWRNGLGLKPSEARYFYAAIVVFTLLGMALNFVGINPMKALVIAGIVQGFSTPPLMLLIVLMTNNRDIMGEQVNGPAMNVLAGITTAAIFAATLGLIATWVL